MSKAKLLFYKIAQKTVNFFKEDEETLRKKEISGQTPVHVAINIILQIGLIVVFMLNVDHQKYPAHPNPPAYPGVGQPGGPTLPQPEPVIPFKRYPAGFDVWGPRPDGSLTSRLAETVMQNQFKFFIEITTYVYLGFALQYSFLRKFGYSTMSFGLLQATVAAQWGIVWMQLIDVIHCQYLKSNFINIDAQCTPPFTAEQISPTYSQKQLRQACSCQLWDVIHGNRSIVTEQPNYAHHTLITIGKMNFDNTFVITLPSLMEGLLATIPVQITYGMLLGKVGPSQLMLCALTCVTCYGINYWIVIYVLGAWDHVGGSCIIHAFGAFFGIGCTLFASPKGVASNPDNSPRYNADVLCTVGVILNWITFPSINAYFAPAAAQQAVVINTYLSLFSSCVASMLFSSLYSQQFKFDPADIQRSCISGGVAISSVASLFVQPYQAMLIGFAGGFACSTSHNFLRKFLEKKLMITDTVGVVSLHAIPSAIAWIAGVISVAPLNTAYMGKWAGTQYISQQTKTLPFGLEYGQIFQHTAGNGDTARYQVTPLQLIAIPPPCSFSS
mmetsp:Transcript_18291/g.60106  ORF Transcript_18291/g.60106 Transcript_18291/m.60106 type:complete len:556 (-) Transcript_18291:270-1937(-)